MGDSPQDVYAKYLPKNRGYPLWSPEPSSTLPSSYRQDGLKIGDVGYVNWDGLFNVLFNITLDPNHALHHRLGVPLNFEPIQLNIDYDVDIKLNADPPGCVITSPGITQPPRTSQRTGHYEFTPSSSKGAILILPDGAMSHNLLANEPFRELAMEHALNWYEIAKTRYGESVSNGSLYLITGFYKARSWSLASFDDVTATDKGSIRVGPRDGERTAAGRVWRNTFPLQYRDGPDPGQYGGINQTVFISGFKIAVRGDLLGWRPPKAEVQPVPDVRPPKDVGGIARLLRLYGDENSSKLRRSAARGADVTHVPTLSQSFHPSDLINQYLLNEDPNALVAVTHDSEWITLIETGRLTTEELTQSVDRLEDILSENYSVVSRPEHCK
ncbi:hypothetical protein EV363DRAFT_1201085 [Boletus edulis]|nr:hypothetical protein EV363DRAFT_1201085 [Boletus edulis]